MLVAVMVPVAVWVSLSMAMATPAVTAPATTTIRRAAKMCPEGNSPAYVPQLNQWTLGLRLGRRASFCAAIDRADLLGAKACDELIERLARNEATLATLHRGQCAGKNE